MCDAVTQGPGHIPCTRTDPHTRGHLYVAAPADEHTDGGRDD